MFRTAYAISRRCRCFANNLRVLSDKGLERALDSVVQEIGRQRLRRLMDADLDHTWPQPVVESLATAGARICNVNKTRIISQLLNTDRNDPEVNALCTIRLLKENTSNWMKLAEELKNRLSDAKRIRACHTRFPVGHMTEDYLRGVIKGEQEEFDFSDDVSQSKISFGLNMQEFSQQLVGKDFVMGVSQSAFDETVTCTGHCRNVEPDAASEFVEALRADAVKDRQLQLRFIDQPTNPLPTDLKSWIKPVFGVLVIDHNFIMKIGRAPHERKLVRTFIEPSGDPIDDELFNEEVAKVNTAIEYFDHDPALASVARILDKHCVDPAPLIEQIRQEKLDALRKSNFSALSDHRPPLRVWLPGR